MATLRAWLRDHRQLVRRVSALETEVQECRRMNLRLAELCDVVMELLVPIEGRDQEAVDKVLARYRDDLSGISQGLAASGE